MPQFNNVMIVTEETAGEGSPLLFPKFSSCTGVVAVLPNTLVGAHFTMDIWAGDQPAKHTQKTLDRLVAKINDRQIDRLVIVGFNQNHNPRKLANALGVAPAACDAYDIGRKNIAELTVIVTFIGQGVRPQVDYKRQSKVDYKEYPRQINSMEDLRQGAPGDATTGKLHSLRKHFVALG